MALAQRWGVPLTYRDLQEMPDDGHRYELVAGVLIVTPAPDRAHQRCVARLTIALSAAAGEDHEVLPAPFDWVLAPSTAFQPDLLVARKAEVGELRLEKTPLLVVEVLSPSTRQIDMGTKRLAFEEAGVPVYWMVDPHEPSLTALRLVRGRYVEQALLRGDEPFETEHPFPVTVVPSELVR